MTASTMSLSSSCRFSHVFVEICELGVNLVNPVRKGLLCLLRHLCGPQDLLAIRADLRGYYYGRQMLFEYHEDLLGHLGREHAELLKTLLDGLLWHSREKKDRKVRVNYYIAELYGEPEKYPDPWQPPLARLVQYADDNTFAHPAVIKVLDLKWRTFGLKLFCIKEFWFNLHLVFFLLEHNTRGDHESVCANGNPDPALRRTLIALSAINLFLQVLFTAQQFRERKLRSLGSVCGVEITVPRSFASAWLWLRLATWITLMVIYSRFSCEGIQLSPCVAFSNGSYSPEGCEARAFAGGGGHTKDKSEDGSLQLVAQNALGFSVDRALISIASLLLWVQVLQCSVLSAPLSAFVFSIEIMLYDLWHSLFFIGLLLLSFGSSLSIIKDDPYDEGFDATLLMLMYEVLGVSSRNYDELSVLSMLMQFVFIIAVTIIMLNILIAQLSLTYEKVMAYARPSSLKHRASVCLDLESCLPMSLRQRLYDTLGFDESLPFSLSDVGPSGGIQEWQSDREVECYVPDRITRFTGDASPEDPWPSQTE